MVFQFDDGDSRAAGFEPNRFCGGLECAAARYDFSGVRENVFEAGPGNDDPAGGRAEAQSAADAGRRCGPSGEVVLGAEGESVGSAAHGVGEDASDGWSSDAGVAVVTLSAASLDHPSDASSPTL